MTSHGTKCSMPKQSIQYIKLRDQEDINLTLSFMVGLYNAFIRGNDLTNAQKQYPEARHISLQSNTHKHYFVLLLGYNTSNVYHMV